MSRTRFILLRLHWFLGITLGASLSFMALSGVTMSFEDEIMLALSPQARVSVPAEGQRLSPAQMIDRLRELRPGERLMSLQVEQRADLAWTAAFQRQKGQRNQRVFVDPYRAVIQGEATGAAFFDTVRNLHRFLSPGGNNPTGRLITGASAVSLIFFALSGLWLRWSAGSRSLRDWLRPDCRLTGRALYRSLHQVSGSWLALLYLVSACSGLWWSSEAYRQGVTWLLSDGAAPVARMKKPGEKQASATGPDWQRVWQRVEQQYGTHYQSALLLIPPPGKTIRIRVLPEGATQIRALDELTINPRTQQVTRFAPYRNQSAGERILTDMDALHTGALFGLPGRIALVISSLCMPLFFVTGLLMYRKRRRQRPARFKEYDE
ncbi:PepSY-associated TM helix domain-containing protein [Erwinia sorbitola]|uniref:PepSY domain-containing protein n=1 Tax=Erwinia sorbitola TaxID=2681984 RepID=A0ABW9RC09_9GAMM|nr:PepSY-associated TM helix domain-containing protein [Erwinia sorbitola]MTD27694.1 hypothetical protein [Erwinia sorbitola]